MKRDAAYLYLLRQGIPDQLVSRSLDRAVNRPGRIIPVGDTGWNVSWSRTGYTVTR